MATSKKADEPTPAKRGRGRPRKEQTPEQAPAKKGRGRPRKDEKLTGSTSTKKTETTGSTTPKNKGGGIPGNQFWKARSQHGRHKIFATPEILWAACCDYFEWIEENPLIEEKVFHAAGIITRANVYHPRAMSITGICKFIGIDPTTWADYRKQADFSKIIAEAEAVIWDQKFSGAAAGLMNGSIIARELGLAEKVQTENSGEVVYTVINAPTGLDVLL